MRWIIVALLAPLAAGAQELKIPLNVEKLAARAENVVDVTLSGKLLALAGKFLDASDPDEARAKKIVQGLKGIYVRVFEFSSPGQYSEADLEPLRSQLRTPVWERMVGVRSRKPGENAEVFLKPDKDEIGGLAIIAADPKSLTVVFIDGKIDPEQVVELGGHFGVPKLEGKPRKEAK